MNNKKINVRRMSDQDLEQMFVNAFEEKAGFCGVQEFSVKATRDVNSENVQFEVDVSGMAGSPTIEDFRNKSEKIKDILSVYLYREDFGGLNVALNPKLTAFLNGNDYLIVYES